MGILNCCAEEKKSLTTPEIVSINKPPLIQSNKPSTPKIQTEKSLGRSLQFVDIFKNDIKKSDNSLKKAARGPDNYQSVKLLGRGLFGQVVLTKQKETHKLYAMKIIEKKKIKQFNLLQSDLIKNIGHEDFLVPIKQTFQNKPNIYIIMQFLPLGDFYFYLQQKQLTFSQQIITNIIAQIVVALGYLHEQGIVYRELKPENILVTQEGHVKLTDYGLSKLMLDDRKSIYTFVGSMQYMAPEAYSGDFGQKADIWSLGMIMYELHFRQHLFASDSKKNIDIEEYLQKISMHDKIYQKVGYMGSCFRDILLKLLEKDPTKRISLEEMRRHDFFKDIDWKQIEARKNDPPLKGILENQYIKFKDAEEKNKRREFAKHSVEKENYEIKLCQFRTSQ